MHPCVLDLLRSLGLPVEGLRSKSRDEFAREVCPVWPGKPVTAHWGVPDPAAVEGPEALDRISLTRQVREIGESGTTEDAVA